MDELALRSLLKTLETSWSSLDRWLNVFTFLVVVGVAAEIIFVSWEYSVEWRDWRRSTIHTPEKPNTLLLVLALIGAGLVALGVAGEFSIHIKAAKVETDMRNATDLLVALVSSEAGTAKTSAEGAANAATRAKSSADLAVRDVAALSPRTLTVNQQREIVGYLRVFSGHPPITVGSYGMDGEGTALATQIMAVIGAATGTMPTDERASVVVSGGFEWGIAIRGPDSERPFMVALQKALTSIGKLQRVSVNGLAPPIGAMTRGRVIHSGNTIMRGGGGAARQPVIPSGGPVSIWVGIKPPPLLPISSK